MSKLFLTGIAVLFLATGAAHSSTHPWDYQCGEIKIRIQTFSATSHQSIFMDMPINNKHTDELERPATLTWDNDGPVVNGIPCKPIEDKEDIYDIDQMVKDMLEKFW
jgi:hypothetical protein